MLAGLELGLAFWWDNPYTAVNPTTPEHTRFHPGGISAYFKVSHLYGDGQDVRLAVTKKLFISNGEDSDKKSLALGGSTTECGLVPEGRRWPDLLQPPAYNYGVSGNTGVDGYYNLKFLTESRILKPERVFVMYAVNDLRAFLSKGVDKFKLEAWHEPPVNPLILLDQVNQKVIGNLRVRDSALLSFLRYSSANQRGRSFYAHYLMQRRQQDKLEAIQPAEFEALLKRFREQFLPARQAVYLAWHKLAATHGLTLVFLTQPHAYRENITPYQEDLRLYPVAGGKRLNLAQAAQLMAELNTQTREIAQLNGSRLIDTAACFEALPANGLFYDSVHYTLRGSQQFASCVNAEAF